MKIDFDKINSDALLCLGSLVSSWIPGGKIEGREYVVLNPKRSDKKAGSFKINVANGTWKDFACTGVAGNDPISLYAYLFTDGAQGDAAKLLSDEIGSGNFEKTEQKYVQQEITPILPVPERAPQRPDEKYIKENGKWITQKIDQFYPYRNIDGDLLGYTALIKNKDGSKGVFPLTFCEFEDGSEKWKFKGFGSPRPMYGAENLSKKPNAMVLLVEGEKCKDYAEELFKNDNNITPVSWCGGTNSAKYADWTPLNNRNVIFWPDADSQCDDQGELLEKEEQQGMHTMILIYNLIKSDISGAKIVDCVDDRINGWDIADFIEEGNDKKQVWSFIKDNIREFESRSEVEEVEPLPEEPEIITEIIPEIEPEIKGKADFVEVSDFEPEKPLNPKRFRPLGYNSAVGTVIYYYMAQGTHKVIELTAANHSKMNLMSLGKLDYFEREYPTKSGAPDFTKAADEMMKDCERIGIYDPNKIRGRGAWFDNDRTVLHLGNRLIVDNEILTIDEIKSKFVYESQAAIETKEFSINNVLKNKEAEKLLDISEMLSWQNKINAKLYAGWIMLAPICGAIDWRPHLWLTGESGTGKTWIQENITSIVLGSCVLSASSNSTEAGLRQMLGTDAFPVIFDEIETEDKESFGRVQKILELARQASSSKNSSIFKGSASGKAVTYIVRSPFLFSSINPKIIQQADNSRISTLKLEKRPDKLNEEMFDKIKLKVIDTITEEWSAKLRGRAIFMIPTIRKNIDIFSTSMARLLKSKRHGDQIGTLLAGAYALKSDKVVSVKASEKFCESVNWKVETEITDLTDHEKCLSVLFQQLIPMDGYQHRYSVGELIKHSIVDVTGIIDPVTKDETAKKFRESRDALRKYGISTIKNQKTDKFDLAIAENHSLLAGLLKETPWHSGYRHIISRIDGSVSKTAVFADSVRARAICIPTDGLFDEDDYFEGTEEGF